MVSNLEVVIILEEGFFEEKEKNNDEKNSINLAIRKYGKIWRRIWKLKKAWLFPLDPHLKLME